MAPILTSSSYADLLQVVAINATVLAILIAALSVYAIVVVQAIDSMITETVEAARGINYIAFRPWTGEEEWYHPEQGETIENALHHLMFRVGRLSGDQPDGVPPFDAVDERARQTMEILTAICGHDPFPQILERRSDGDHPVRWLVKLQRTPVNLDTLDAVDAWLPRIRHALEKLHQYVVDSFQTDGLFAAASRKFRAAQPPPSGDEMDAALAHKMTEVVDPATSFLAVKSFLQKAESIVANTMILRDRVESYRARLRRVRVPILAAFAVMAVAFAVGVVVPLLVPSFSPGLAAKIPAVAYSLLLVGGLTLLARLLLGSH